MSLVSRHMKDTIVYWPKPSYDGFHAATYDSGYPVEIKGRWEDKEELFKDATGNEARSQAIVYTDVAVELGGFLFRGLETNLDSSQDAQTQAGAYVIQRVDKRESLTGRDVFYRVVL